MFWETGLPCCWWVYPETAKQPTFCGMCKKRYLFERMNNLCAYNLVGLWSMLCLCSAVHFAVIGISWTSHYCNLYSHFKMEVGKICCKVASGPFQHTLPEGVCLKSHDVNAAADIGWPSCSSFYMAEGKKRLESICWSIMAVFSTDLIAGDQAFNFFFCFFAFLFS